MITLLLLTASRATPGTGIEFSVNLLGARSAATDRAHAASLQPAPPAELLKQGGPGVSEIRSMQQEARGLEAAASTLTAEAEGLGGGDVEAPATALVGNATSSVADGAGAAAASETQQQPAELQPGAADASQTQVAGLQGAAQSTAPPTQAGGQGGGGIPREAVNDRASRAYESSGLATAVLGEQVAALQQQVRSLAASVQGIKDSSALTLLLVTGIAQHIKQAEARQAGQA